MNLRDNMDNEALLSIYDELNYFQNRKAIQLNKGATISEIERAESILKCKFDPGMILFLLQNNGGRIADHSLYGIQTERKERISKQYDIIENSQQNEKMEAWDPRHIVIGSDCFGCYYVIDREEAQTSEAHPVYYLDHESVGENAPLIFFASSYLDFLRMIILESQTVWNPDGSIKMS